MLNKTLKQKLDSCIKQNRLRHRVVISRHESNGIVVNNKSCINFSSNDYLGLSHHPNITEAFVFGVKKYGFGGGASAHVSGYFDSHHEFERQFAQWLGVDKAILFNSGYLANMGVMTALVERDSVVLSDRACHASILDGIQLSRAKHYRYNHGCIEHLMQLSQQYNPDVIVTESVFSMTGDIASIQKIIGLAQADVIIDDAHGIGILGKHGLGICEYANINQQQFSCLIAPLGKAFNGLGAIVAGRSDVIEAILQFANSYRYTTALPPAIAVALLASLKVVKDESWRREALIKNIEFFVGYAKQKKISLLSSELTPIKSIMIGTNEQALHIQSQLYLKGFYLSCIRPPTVPQRTARLRISLNCLHTQEQMTRLLEGIAEALE